MNVHGPVDSDFKKWTFLKHLCNYIDCLDYQLYFYTSIHVLFFQLICVEWVQLHCTIIIIYYRHWSHGANRKMGSLLYGSLIYWHLRHWHNSKRFTLRLMVYRIQSIVADVSSPLCACATDEHFASSWPATFSSFSCIYENASKHYTDT